MSPLLARAVAHVHGHLGWLAALALLHPAWLLRRPRRRALAAALAATLVATATAALGILLYPTYRQSLKPGLLSAAPIAAALFERKEHLGIGALVLAWVGLALHGLWCRDRPGAASLARAAFAAYVGAAGFAVVTAVLGVVVAVRASL